MPSSTPSSRSTGALGTVLVTGAASGLGAATVAAVREAGGRALGLDRVPVEGIPHEVVDLSDTRAAEDAVRRLVDGAGGTVDAVVTAAGTDTPSPFEELDGADWDRIVMVNLLGTAATVRAAMPYLRRSDNPRVVTVSSTLGHRVFGDATAYTASKFGVVGFTRGLQAELKGQVGVTLLTPGGMSTAFFDDRDAQYKPGPDAKLNRAEDVAMNIVHVLTQPPGCHVYELVVASLWEDSWPA